MATPPSATTTPLPSDAELFERYLIGAVAHDNKDRADSFRALLRSFGGTPDAADQLLLELQNGITAWKRMKTSFLDIVKWGTVDVARRALAAGTPDPSQATVHSTYSEFPITAAIAKGDTEMVRVMLASGRVNLLVNDFQTNGGCGILTVEYFSPLGLALRNKQHDIALLLIAAHPNLAGDAAFGVKSSFEGDSAIPLAELARQWGDPDVLAALAAKATSQQQQQQQQQHS